MGPLYNFPEASIQQHLFGKPRGAAWAKKATEPFCHLFYLLPPFYPLHAYIPQLVRNSLAGRTHYCLHFFPSRRNHLPERRFVLVLKLQTQTPPWERPLKIPNLWTLCISWENNLTARVEKELRHTPPRCQCTRAHVPCTVHALLLREICSLIPGTPRWRKEDELLSFLVSWKN